MNTELLARIHAAENDNEHTVALMIKARAMNNDLGNSFVVILQEIADEHELEGELNPVNKMLRQSIDMKLRHYNEFLGLPAQPVFTS